MRPGKHGLAERCLDAAGGDPELGLVYAIRATRWKLIASGDLQPGPNEQLPLEVRRARKQLADRLAA